MHTFKSLNVKRLSGNIISCDMENDALYANESNARNVWGVGGSELKVREFRKYT